MIKEVGWVIKIEKIIKLSKNQKVQTVSGGQASKKQGKWEWKVKKRRKENEEKEEIDRYIAAYMIAWAECWSLCCWLTMINAGLGV